MSVRELSEADLDCPIIRPRSGVAELPRSIALEADRLADEVARRWGTTSKEMLSNGPGSRVKHLAAARAELYLALRARGWSYPSIGRFAGGRDHTTVMAAVRSV